MTDTAKISSRMCYIYKGVIIVENRIFLSMIFPEIEWHSERMNGSCKKKDAVFVLFDHIYMSCLYFKPWKASIDPTRDTQARLISIFARMIVCMFLCGFVPHPPTQRKNRDLKLWTLTSLDHTYKYLFFVFIKKMTSIKISLENCRVTEILAYLLNCLVDCLFIYS